MSLSSVSSLCVCFKNVDCRSLTADDSLNQPNGLILIDGSVLACVDQRGIAGLFGEFLQTLRHPAAFRSKQYRVDDRCKISALLAINHVFREHGRIRPVLTELD